MWAKRQPLGFDYLLTAVNSDTLLRHPSPTPPALASHPAHCAEACRTNLAERSTWREGFAPLQTFAQ